MLVPGDDWISEWWLSWVKKLVEVGFAEGCRFKLRAGEFGKRAIDILILFEQASHGYKSEGRARD